jgi:hypothetical protein
MLVNFRFVGLLPRFLRKPLLDIQRNSLFDFIAAISCMLLLGRLSAAYEKSGRLAFEVIKVLVRKRELLHHVIWLELFVAAVTTLRSDLVKLDEAVFLAALRLVWR